MNRAAVAALNRRPRDKFFLYVHYVDVHDYVFQKTTYAEAVKEMDQGVGRLLAQLESAKLLEDAVVVLASDHGEQLGEMHNFPGEFPKSFGHYGNPSFQEQLRIPLIVAPARGGDPHRFLRTQDIFDLLLEIAGAPREPSRDIEPDELLRRRGPLPHLSPGSLEELHAPLRRAALRLRPGGGSAREERRRRAEPGRDGRAQRADRAAHAQPGG